MEAWVHALLAALALPKYGLVTLFFVALLSATLLPHGQRAGSCRAALSEPRTVLACDVRCHRGQHHRRRDQLVDGLGRRARVREGQASQAVGVESAGVAGALRAEGLPAGISARRRRSVVRARRLVASAVLALRGLHGHRQVSALCPLHRCAVVVLPWTDGYCELTEFSDEHPHLRRPQRALHAPAPLRASGLHRQLGPRGQHAAQGQRRARVGDGRAGCADAPPAHRADARRSHRARRAGAAVGSPARQPARDSPRLAAGHRAAGVAGHAPGAGHVALRTCLAHAAPGQRLEGFPRQLEAGGGAGARGGGTAVAAAPACRSTTR